MSKREGTPKVLENTPDAKKPKLEEAASGSQRQGEAAAPQQQDEIGAPHQQGETAAPQRQGATAAPQQSKFNVIFNHR